MNRRILSLIAAGLLLCSLPLAADEESIHLTGPQNVGWNWQLNDGAGCGWQISSNGACYGGTNNIYSAGMQLYVANQTFSWGNNGIGGTDGREVEIGPWSAGATRVSRRIYIDPKAGYCRWIDIFENTAGSEQTVAVRYYSSMGCPTRQVNTLGGMTDPTDKDWAVITSDPSNSSYPPVVHIFCARNAKVRPKFQYTKNNSSLYYNLNLKIPAGKPVALCFFEAQVKQVGEGEKFLKDFNLNKELAKIPKPLRKLLANMAGAQTLGGLELPRDEKNDLIVTTNDNELMGTILNEKYALKTTFGDLEIKAEQVVGMSVPAGEEVVQIALTDGQVVSGKCADGAIKLKLADGGDMAVSLSKLKTAAYRISASRPEEIVPKSPLVVLRSGQQLAFPNPAQADCSYETQHGELKLNPADLRAIHLDTPEGGLHRVLFTNGSVLSGLLVAESLKLNLSLGPTLDVRRYLVREIVFPGPALEPAGLAELTMRNEDEIFGHIVGKTITVESRASKVDIAVEDIAEMEFPVNAFGQVKVKLHNGTTLSGKFGDKALRFKIDPGPELAVSIGHINQVVCPKPEPKPTTNPTTGATTKEAPKEPGSPASSAAVERISAEIKQQEAVLAELQALAAKLQGLGKPEELAGVQAKIKDVQAQLDELKKKAEAMKAAELESSRPSSTSAPTPRLAPKTRNALPRS